CSQEVCDCLQPGVEIRVEGAEGRIVQVTTSGPGCAGAQPRCIDSRPEGCAHSLVLGTAEGSCEIDIQLTDGSSLSRSLSFIRQDGCCSGLYPQNPSDGIIHIPSTADGGTD